MSLTFRILLFTVVVPGAGAVWIPGWILARFNSGATSDRMGGGRCYRGRHRAVRLVRWVFAVVGRGTPGPWDVPRRVVAVGPYRWVHNPIDIAALLVVLREAWPFLSPPLLVYAGVIALLFHIFVVGYEERTFRRRFGDVYLEYVQAVHRWIPRRP